MNPGKRFEQDFKASVCGGLYAFRLQDCGGWSREASRRFTPSNPFDFFLYAWDLGTAMALELKSTAGTSISYQALSATQHKGLLQAAEGGLCAGALVEWRAEPHEVIYVPIDGWVEMENASPKKSMTRDECRAAGVVVHGERKRTRYSYDLLSMVRSARYTRRAAL